MRVLFAFCTLAVALCLAAEPYEGHKVLRVKPTEQEHHDKLSSLRDEYDFWSDPAGPNIPVDIRVTDEQVESFQTMLVESGIDFDILVEDVAKLIEEVEGKSATLKREPRGIRRPWTPWWAQQPRQRASIVGTYATYDDIVSWTNDMCSKYSSLAQCGSIGTSYEGRDIRYMKLGSNTGSAKKEIFIQSGIHAREWIAPATMIYIVNKMLTEYSTNADAKRMLDTYDFFVVPSANPDGYEYSQTRGNRLWRKTRSPQGFCVGVDPNRNYDVYWATSGSSNSPCSDIYHGPSAFSEPETKALSDFIKARQSKILAYFDVHCYSQMWLIPYADKKNHYAENYDELVRNLSKLNYGVNFNNLLI